MPQVKSKSRNQDSEPDAQVESAADFGRGQASVSKRKPSGTKVSLPQPIRRDIGEFASGFRKKYGLLDRPTAERIARLIRTSITPRRRPGRPATREVLQAVELRRKGIPWAKVFPQVIADYWNLPYEKQYYRRDKLRRAVGAYFRRRRTKRSNREREKDLSEVRPRSDTG